MDKKMIKAIIAAMLAGLLLGNNSFASFNSIYEDSVIRVYADDATQGDADKDTSEETSSEEGTTGSSETTTQISGSGVNDNSFISYTTTRTITLTEDELIARYGDVYSSKLTDAENARNFLNNLKKDQNDFIEEMKEIDDLILAYNDNINAITAEQEQLEILISETSESLLNAKEEEAAQQEIIKEHIKQEYENSNYNLIDVFVNAISFADLANKNEYIKAVNSFDQSELDELTGVRRSVANKSLLLESALEDNEQLVKDYIDAEQALEILADHKQAQVESYNREIRVAEDKYNDLMSELEKMISVTESTTVYVYTGNGYEGGKLLWPCPGSTSISSGFGGRNAPTAGASTYHKGIDIPVASGSPAIAAADGIVIYTGYMGSGGQTVMIEHGGGMVTVYHHLSGYNKKAGDEVKAGDVVAFTGNTGVSTGPHLHFGVRINGQYVDPLKFYN